MLWSWLVNTVAASRLMPKSRRWRALRMLGLDIAPSTIAPNSFFGGKKITIGERTFVNQECFFDALDSITIGKDCSFGPRVMVLTSSHEIGLAHRRAGSLNRSPVIIGDGCWLGASSTILPGVTVGDGCMIAAGALVTSDCEPNGLYAGVPARRVRELN